MWVVTSTQGLDFAHFSLFKNALEEGLCRSFVVLSMSYCHQNPTEEIGINLSMPNNLYKDIAQ
jgi:hypothetical protein